MQPQDDITEGTSTSPLPRQSTSSLCRRSRTRTDPSPQLTQGWMPEAIAASPSVATLRERTATSARSIRSSCGQTGAIALSQTSAQASAMTVRARAGSSCMPRSASWRRPEERTTIFPRSTRIPARGAERIAASSSSGVRSQRAVVVRKSGM